MNGNNAVKRKLDICEGITVLVNIPLKQNVTRVLNQKSKNNTQVVLRWTERTQELFSHTCPVAYKYLKKKKKTWVYSHPWNHPCCACSSGLTGSGRGLGSPCLKPGSFLPSSPSLPSPRACPSERPQRSPAINTNITLHFWWSFLDIFKVMVHISLFCFVAPRYFKTLWTDW